MKIGTKENTENIEHTHEISLEIDGIMMTLASITAISENVFTNIDSYNTELDRFDILAEILGNLELLCLRQRCQTNLTEFAENQSDSDKQFIAKSECWVWLSILVFV